MDRKLRLDQEPAGTLCQDFSSHLRESSDMLAGTGEGEAGFLCHISLMPTIPRASSRWSRGHGRTRKKDEADQMPPNSMLTSWLYFWDLFLEGRAEARPAAEVSPKLKSCPHVLGLHCSRLPRCKVAVVRHSPRAVPMGKWVRCGLWGQ